jgi:putative ABC transport system permease protein
MKSAPSPGSPVSRSPACPGLLRPVAALARRLAPLLRPVAALARRLFAAIVRSLGRFGRWLAAGKPIGWPTSVSDLVLGRLDAFGGFLIRLGRPLGPICRPTGRLVRRLVAPQVRILGRMTARLRAALGPLAVAGRPVWIRLSFSAQMAGYAILAKPLRSALTALGVAIGVASVVSLMGVGEGARQAVMQQFQSLGANVIVIRAEDPSIRFRPEDARILLEQVDRLTLATPVVQTKSPLRWRRTRGEAQIVGVNEQFPAIRDHALISGHFFTGLHVEQRSPVAVLGYNVAVSLMRGRSPVGQTFTMAGHTYRIVGVLESKGEGSGEGIDNKVLIPYTTALQIAKTRTVSEIWCKARSSEDADLALVQLGRIFRRRLGIDQSAPTLVPSGDSGTGGEPGTSSPAEPGPPSETPPVISGGKTLITITNLNRLVKEADKANRVMTLLLGGIAAVSLLVGGLGIMNIMLVAVTERTAEIGVRRALGAKQSDLLTQFLLESFLLSAVGAIAGVALGLWGAGLFERYGLETAISLTAVEVAVAVALGTGLIFGVYPAWAASSVPPVEALRR